METGQEKYLKEGKTYAATPKDTCLVCKELIGEEEYVTCLELDPSWDGVEKLDFNRHVTDELKGYKHFRCTNK